MENKQLEVLLPAIRKVLPGLIAQDIVGVQPMMISNYIETGETYVDEASSYATEANTVEYYWARLPIDVGAIFTMGAHGKYVNEVEAWCEETFGPRCSNEHPEFAWDKFNGCYCFKSEQDRTAFVLKWSK